MLSLSILSFYNSLKYFAFNTTHVFASYLPFPLSPLSICFSIHLGLDASCLQLPIFGIAERTPPNPFPPIRLAGKRPVTEFSGNAFVITLVSADNPSSEIKNVIQRRGLWLLTQAGRLYRCMTQKRSCLRIHSDQNNFTKHLDYCLQAHPWKLSLLCHPLEAAPKKGEKTFFPLLVGIYTSWEVGLPRFWNIYSDDVRNCIVLSWKVV